MGDEGPLVVDVVIDNAYALIVAVVLSDDLTVELGERVAGERRGTGRDFRSRRGVGMADFRFESLSFWP